MNTCFSAPKYTSSSIISLSKNSTNSQSRQRIVNPIKTVSNEFHTYIKNARKQMQLELDNFHHSCLKDKYNDLVSSGSNLFLTRSSLGKDSKNNVTSFSNDRIKKQKKKVFLSSLHNPRVVNPLFAKSLYEKNYDYNAKGSVAKFVNNTKTFHRLKVLSNCQNEKYKKYLEEIDKQYDEIRIKTYASQNNFKLMNITVETLSNFVKHINSQVDIEKQKLLTILSFHKELEIANKVLQQKIMKAENKLNLYKDYKTFLLKVKYKVQNTNQIPKDIQIKYGLILPIEESKPVKRTSQMYSRRSTIQRNTNRSLLKGRRSSNVSYLLRGNTTTKTISSQTNKSIKTEERPIDEEKNYNLPIFNTVEEFHEQFSKIEFNTFYLFSNFNNDPENLTNLRKDNAHERGFYNRVEQEDKQYIDSLQKHLIKLKAKNNELVNTKAKLTTLNDKAKILCRVRDQIQTMLMSFPINIESELDEPQIYQKISSHLDVILVNGVKTNKLLYSIGILEKLIIQLSMRLRIFKSNPKNIPLYNQCRMILDKKNKEEKNKKNKIKELNKQKVLVDKVIKKNQKIIYKQSRMVHFSPVFISRKTKDKSSLHSQNTFNEYESMLTY